MTTMEAPTTRAAESMRILFVFIVGMMVRGYLQTKRDEWRMRRIQRRRLVLLF